MHLKHLPGFGLGLGFSEHNPWEPWPLGQCAPVTHLCFLFITCIYFWDACLFVLVFREKYFSVLLLTVSFMQE